MSILQIVSQSKPTDFNYLFWCPGCDGAHGIKTTPPEPTWKWNGSVDKPTFHPSLLIGRGTSFICHSFITDGMIRFLDDCSHDLKGQTVMIPDWDDR